MMFENINEGLLDFLEKSPTAFHAVSNIRAALQASGYTELSERTATLRRLKSRQIPR